ncbi:YncE family protein [Rhodopseudomonas palustris]
MAAALLLCALATRWASIARKPNASCSKDGLAMRNGSRNSKLVSRARRSAKRCSADPGPFQALRSVTAPALQRTTPQERRAALRPGHDCIAEGGHRIEAGRAMTRGVIVAAALLSLIAATPAAASIAYISNEESNTVSVIDTNIWSVTATIKVGQRPRGIEFTRDGKFVLVAVGDDDTIELIDVAAQKVFKTIQVGELPWGITVAPK